METSLYGWHFILPISFCGDHITLALVEAQIVVAASANLPLGDEFQRFASPPTERIRFISILETPSNVAWEVRACLEWNRVDGRDLMSFARVARAAVATVSSAPWA